MGLLLASVLLAFRPLAAQEQHPRLFVSEPHLDALRPAVNAEGGHHARAWSALAERVDTGRWQTYDVDPSDGNWNYARTWLAREAAFAYLLTGEAAYAATAYDALDAVLTDPDPDGRSLTDGYGLARAMLGMGFALAYDWAYHGWTEPQRARIRGAIEAALDRWPDYEHANLDTEHRGSNWVGVCRSAELIMMLAVYKEDDRPARYAELKQGLGKHLETAYGSSGWSQEGPLYTSYAGQFLAPARYALQSVGDLTLEPAFASLPWQELQMAIGAFTSDRLQLMSGVDGGAGADGQGWPSLLLGWSGDPATDNAYRAFYDQFMGVDAPGDPARAFDPHRAGTVWAILRYPTDPPEAPSRLHDPLVVLDRERGAFFFRNAVNDRGDILVSIMGDADHHSHAWDVPEAFQLGLIAHGTLFFGGPGKAATGRSARHDGFSSLLVDGQAFASGYRTGVVAEADSGYIVVRGGEKYRGLGLDHAERHLLVEFPDSSSAVLGVLDRVRSDSSHTYTFQINLGPPYSDGGVTATREPDAPVPSFTLWGRDGGVVRGWVLAPADATLHLGDPLRITTTAADADLWVAFWVGDGDPPEAIPSGQGLDAALRIESATLRFDGERQVLLNGRVER